MLRFLLLVAALVGVILLVRWLLNEDPRKVAAALRRGALWATIIVLILLAATGKLHWIFAAIAAAVPFVSRILYLLRYLPLFSQLYTMVQNAQAARAGPGTPGQKSQVEARYVRMELDHDSGEIDGTVLLGAHQGKRLSQLTLAQVLELYQSAAGDDRDSAALLEAYLDRVHGDWREQSNTGSAQDFTPSAKMSRAEALEILGVTESATREEIIQAHRRLMQKLHPDRGGSTYLAAKINQAKDVLIPD